MDNSSIRGRFSLSTTNLTSPIAESTCLNGISSRSKFNWGETTISTRARNNSHSTVDQNTSMSKNLNGIPTKVTMSPSSSRIDPRTYVDIHSNGLASRIVKYHDNSSRLNRSLSMTNLYNKPGQFPVVHLKKNEQQYKAKKTKNLSMTRIAAPEKSVFHGNTLSSILRSGSIVGLQKSDEEISRENRPIIHPPPTENEMAPTRSVLEVLKEISRKRINSDEMDGTELTKKQCKEPEQDAASNVGQRTQSKRQREITNSSANNAQISPEQQVIKKRMCNYNNDIMSSLSSSMASVNKKKMLEIQSQKRTASDLGVMSASKISNTEFELSPNEKHRCIGNFETQHSGASTKFTPITPLLSVQHQNVSELDGDARSGIVTRRASEPALGITKPKLTLFNKDYDEIPTVVSNDTPEIKEDGDLCGIQFVKPKKSSSISSGGSLLMEKTKKSKLALMLSGLKGELDEEDEVDAGPSKEDQQKVVEISETNRVTSASNITSSNVFSKMTTTVAAPKPVVANKSAIEEVSAKPTEVTSEVKLTLSTITSTNSTLSGALKTNPLPVLSTASTTLPQIALPSVTTSAPISSTPSTTASNPVAGGFSFGLSTQKTTTTNTSSATLLPSSTLSQTIISTASTSASTSVSQTNSIAGSKLFAFGTTTTQSSASSIAPFTFGTPTTTSQSVESTKEQAVVTNTFVSPITKATDSAPAVFGQSSTSSQPTFSFGLPVGGKTSTNTLTTNTALPATTNALTANFGSQKNTWSSVSTATPTNTNSMHNAIPSFGSLSSLPQSTTSLTSSSAGGFSFAPNSSNETTKSLFGNIAPTNTTSTNSNATFSFSANKTQATPSNTIGAFTFGSGASSAAVAVSTTALSLGTTVSVAKTNTAPAFGTTVAPATNNTTVTFGTTVAPASSNTALTFGNTVAPAATNVVSQNIFGNAASPKPSNTFSFGSAGPSATSQNGAFAFSSSDKTPAAVPATGGSVGGFSFNNPPVNFIPVAEPSKNIFGTAAAAAAATSTETKSAFNFGSSTTNNSITDKPIVFGASTNIFGTPAASSTAQTSAFNFGSSSSETTNQGPNPFGSAQTSNLTSGLGTSSGTNSIFGAPSAAVAPLQQSSTFTFGASSSNTKQEVNKPAGGFVFGSSSSFGSNASKPAVDMNKTFVFGDGNTTIKPAPSSSSSVFGASNGTNGVTENKMFSFGSNAGGGSNNSFTAGRQTVNPAPAFNFGGGAPAAGNAAPAPNSNLFAPQGTQPDRVFKKATRRLHKAN